MLVAHTARYALLTLMALSPFAMPALRADADDDLKAHLLKAEKEAALRREAEAKRKAEEERREAQRREAETKLLAKVPELAKQAAAQIAADIRRHGAKPTPGAAFAVAELQAAMQWIAPGTFTMGTPGDTGDESPVTVTLTQGYWLGTTEVTQAQWRAVMGTNPANFKGDNLPVEQVFWYDAMDFCKKLTERERAAGRLPAGYAYILPTEAQWEYACRAGTTGNYAGDLDTMAWHGENAASATHPVGTKQTNAWGLYDIHGNVWEWCRDWYGDNLPGGTDPSGAASGSSRVLRGGSWYFDAGYCRSAFRFCFTPDDRYFSIGFRLALSSVSQAE